MLFVSTHAEAQTARVSGTVINQRTSAALVGATVSVKTSNRSTVTDEAGRFSIEAAQGDILTITSVGFELQEIKVGSGDVRVEMKEADNTMETVVVIGYGTQKKKLVTGANLQVKGDDLKKQSTTNALQALQGASCRCANHVFFRTAGRWI